MLAYTRDHSQGRRFIAGAFFEGEKRDPATAYLAQVDIIRAHGGMPILFQCSALLQASEIQVLDVYKRVGKAGGPLLAFELGTMFAPFGRIYSEDGSRDFWTSRRSLALSILHSTAVRSGHA